MQRGGKRGLWALYTRTWPAIGRPHIPAMAPSLRRATTTETFPPPTTIVEVLALPKTVAFALAPTLAITFALAFSKSKSVAPTLPFGLLWERSRVWL